MYFRRFLLCILVALCMPASVFASGDLESYISDSIIDITDTEIRSLSTLAQSKMKVKQYNKILGDKYVVAFNANGGEGTMQESKVFSNESFNLPKNQFTRDGYTFVGWATEAGKDAVNMTHFQQGEVTYQEGEEVKSLAKAQGRVTLYACWKGSGGKAAADWGKLIAEDDSFSYGPKPISSSTGCYFCGTNGKKFERAKGTKWEGDKRWEKTYVCTTFVNACLAHGANNANCYNKCSKGGIYVSGDPDESEMDKKPDFERLGKPAKSELQPGDVLIKDHVHAALYYGDGYYVECTGGTWEPKAIIWHELTDKIYNRYTSVYRMHF